MIKLSLFNFIFPQFVETILNNVYRDVFKPDAKILKSRWSKC